MSAPSDPLLRLPPAAEELLEGWPVPEKDDQFWNEAAETVMTRVEMARAGSTDEALLAAPLPTEIGEDALGARTAPAAAAKAAAPPPSAAPVSLADLARAVASETSASDNKDIARESLSLAARARTSAPSIAESIRQEAARISVPTPAPPPPMPVAAVPAPPPIDLGAARASRPPKRSLMAPVLAVGVVLAGMAAAAVIVVRHQQKASAPVAVATVAAPDTAAPPPAAEGPKPEAKADLEITSPDQLGSGGDAPGAATGTALAQMPRAAAKAGAGAPPSPAEPKAPPAQSTPEEKQPEKTAGKDDPEAAKMKPAAQPTNVPQEPSLGAAQAAIGSVLGGARACVAGHDAPSRATVVFGSDGRVQSVAVSGPAAGTPAEACIRAAMSRARVEPFAKPTFSVGTPIRP